MPIPEANYHAHFQEESPQFYGNLAELEQEAFNNWVINNFIEIGTINSYEEVVPNGDLIEDVVSKGYEHIEGQCHYSGKAVSILDCEYEYYTGFVHRQSQFDHILITHSFNMKDGRIVDFARLDEELSPMPDNPNAEDFFGLDNPFPQVYYGIQIPSEFVGNYREATLEGKSMNPLIYEWYLEVN